eukprot:sb/3472873/
MYNISFSHSLILSFSHSPFPFFPLSLSHYLSLSLSLSFPILYLSHSFSISLSLSLSLILLSRPCRIVWESADQEPTETSKQPIRTRYLGHVTGYQPIKRQYLLIRSVPAMGDLSKLVPGLRSSFQSITKEGLEGDKSHTKINLRPEGAGFEKVTIGITF